MKTSFLSLLELAGLPSSNLGSYCNLAVNPQETFNAMQNGISWSVCSLSMCIYVAILDRGSTVR